LHEGYDAEQLERYKADLYVVGQRDDARQAGGRGDPRPGAALCLGAAVARRARVEGQVGPRGRRGPHGSEHDRPRSSPGSSRTTAQSPVPHRRHRAQLRRPSRATPSRPSS
jgi:hypothetical protein